MIIQENLLVAVNQLKSGKMRSLLTTLGITIGIGTVIFIVAVLEGYNKSITEELNILGANTFQVQKRDINTGIQVGHQHREFRKDLKRELAVAIRENCDMIEAVGAEVWQYGQSIHYKDKHTNPNIMVAGAEPEFFVNNGYFVESGRFLTPEDIASHKKVTVLGMDAVDVLFPFENPIGKLVRIAGQKYQVVGTLERLGNSTFGESRDNVGKKPLCKSNLAC
ncbi:MAG: ABC transporter permease [Calditrichaceae bacterium]